MLVLVSYDVSTVEKVGRTRLRRVAKICQNFGQKVQLSVFECIVDPAQWTVFRQKLTDIIDPKQDSLCFNFLGAKWYGSDRAHGRESSYRPGKTARRLKNNPRTSSSHGFPRRIADVISH